MNLKKVFQLNLIMHQPATVNDYLSDIINSLPNKKDFSDSYEYWSKENYPLDGVGFITKIFLKSKSR